MKIFSNDSYSNLKSIIVGVELNIPKRILDFSVKHFYQSNLGHSVYENPNITGYRINEKYLRERIDDLDNLAIILKKLNVRVFRPKNITKIMPFRTPSFESAFTSSASNVRDLTIVIDDCIVEMPIFVQNRYFENLGLYDIFKNALFSPLEFDDDNAHSCNNCAKWFRAPLTDITENTIDTEHWSKKRDYSNFEKINNKYVMGLDGAQILKMRDNMIVNVASYNHYLGFLWLKNLFPSKNWEMVTIADNHIDGSIVQLNDDLFLVNPSLKNNKTFVSELPDFMQNKKFIYPYDIPSNRELDDGTDIGIQLASERGMDINILSINEKTVLVNENAHGTIQILDEYGFDVIPIQLRHSEIFAGGIHCSTLDLLREPR